MKKLKVAAFVVASALLYAGCGEKAVTMDGSAVIFDKDGKIESQLVNVLDQDYYNAEELKSMVENEIRTYNAINGEGSVELTAYTYKEDSKNIKIIMTFDSMDSYAGYNSKNDSSFSKDTCYYGKVDDSKTDISSLKAVEKGNKTDTAYEQKENQTMVVLQGEYGVAVPGNIVAAGDNVEIIGKTQAKLTSAEKPACIIYENN